MDSTLKKLPIWPGLDMSKRVQRAADLTRKSTDSMVTVMASRMIREEFALKEKRKLAMR